MKCLRKGGEMQYDAYMLPVATQLFTCQLPYLKV